MKKIFSLMLVAMLSLSAMAGSHEIGGVVGGMNGLSYKYWMGNNLAIQADLAVGLSTIAGGSYYKGSNLGNGSWSIYDFTINPNLVYNFNLPANFYLYAGGGCNFGLISDINNTNSNGIAGKFGINAMVGTEYKFNGVPLALAFDFRPGYGLGFTTADAPHTSFFDWKLAFAVRYCL